VPIRILIVDDSAAIRQAVRSCIESNTELEICGEAENGVVALDMVRKVNPDVVVLDLAMPGMNGLAVAQEIRASAPDTRMVMFTANDCEALLEQAKGAGISRVIAKSGDGVVNHLLAAIRDVFHERDAA
jgi:DNA-binding NarL/FixJ family response regulator